MLRIREYGLVGAGPKTTCWQSSVQVAGCQQSGRSTGQLCDLDKVILPLPLWILYCHLSNWDHICIVFLETMQGTQDAWIEDVPTSGALKCYGGIKEELWEDFPQLYQENGLVLPWMFFHSTLNQHLLCACPSPGVTGILYSHLSIHSSNELLLSTYHMSGIGAQSHLREG